MADIFLSYKRADASHAAKIVALLENEGWSVWWDDRISAGDYWNAEIAREIGATRCVVVIWSPNSIDPSKAHWVHEEAHNGRGRGILVPVTIEGVVPPLGFTLVQARNLSRWDGATRHGAAADFLADVRKMLGQAPAAPAVTPQTAPVQPADAGGPKLALAAEEWGRLKDTADIAKLRRFVQHFSGTYYAELAEERIAGLEEAARAQAAAEAAAGAKAAAEAERKRAEAARAQIREKIARTGERDALFALWPEDPEAAAARLQELGFVEVASRKDGKPATYWLKPGESFRDLDTAPEMVVVPPTKEFFWMGSKDGEGSDSERPRHRVTIAKPFAVGKYPVTFAEWDAALAAGGVKHKPETDWGRGRQPVMRVSWDDAQAYVKWLSAATGQPYRLLSEAEWEYCCRAGTETAFSFGDKESDLDRHAWYWSNSGKQTHPVGEKAANNFGLHDMHGNVWEWCQDCWNDNYHNTPADGSARTTGDCSRRVLRGGSWSDDPRDLRSAYRYWNTADNRDDDIGFRLARTLSY